MITSCWRKSRLVGFFIALSLYNNANAGENEDALKGIAAYQQGNYVSALRQVRPLAERGDPSMQRVLGVMYATGRGVPKDAKAAVVWYRKAADQGNAQAELAIAYAYSLGEGVPQNESISAKWFRKAADQGNGEAQDGMGVLYLIGKGVPQDFMLAYMWFALATVHGETAEIREQALQHRNGVLFRLTGEQIEEAQKMARLWRPRTD